ncbi:MAG: hypothetical protein OXE52_13775 [Chloroflexi bacterium]|nr:hypothetical protein [Chloroflexota bacterium]
MNIEYKPMTLELIIFIDSGIPADCDIVGKFVSRIDGAHPDAVDSRKRAMAGLHVEDFLAEANTLRRSQAKMRTTGSGLKDTSETRPPTSES